MATVTVEALLDAPCPRAGLTITGLGVGESVVSVWRTADGERNPVRGARRAVMNDATFLVDYDAPLGRPITYELEVISGPAGASRITSAPVTVDSAEAWIMDPLVPQSAVAISRRMSSMGEPVFMVTAMRNFEYQANISVYEIMGSDRPMALIGQRAAARGVNLSLVTDMAEQNSRVRNLFKQASQILVRVPKSLTDAIEGSCFLSVATIAEDSRKAHTGRALTTWTVQGDTVAAPTIKVLTATFTWGHVSILFDTWGQKRDAVIAAASAAGESPTWLFDLKHPIG